MLNQVQGGLHFHLLYTVGYFAAFVYSLLPKDLFYNIMKRIHVGISNIIYSEQSLFIYEVSA